MWRRNIGWGVVAAAALLGLGGAGLSGFLICGGTAAAVLGIIRLVRAGKGGGARRSRGPAVLATVAGLALLMTGTAVSPAAPPQAGPTAPVTPHRTGTSSESPPEPKASPVTSQTPSQKAVSPGTRNPATPGSASPAPSTAPPTAAAPAAGPVGAALALLPVKGRAAKTGYDRDQFGTAWTDTDHNGCDQRNDILRRDLTGLHTKPGTHGCVLASGQLSSPYTGQHISFRRGASPVTVQIDHVVALGDAWQTGADQWTASERAQLANDPLNLLAVDSHSNESKGDGDAATWLPPRRTYRCAYVARQVAVKTRYHLWVTPAEHDAIARILTSCPDQALPTTRTSNIPTPRPTDEPGPTATPTPTSRTTSRPTSQPTQEPGPGTPTVVHPGAYCSPEGATGVTDRGTPMTCSARTGDDRARWRHR